MDRARRHQRLLSGLAFGLLALVAELVGRSLTYRLDVGRHVSSPGYAGADYYPFLLAGVKIGIALLLARLAWRFARAHAAACAARRLLAAVGSRPSRVPRVRVVFSPRLWLTSFIVTSLFYLVQTDAERLSIGQWAPLLSPWLHTSALPVFAVLAVLVAVVWGAVAGWLADYERFAEAAVAHAHRAVRASQPLPVHRTTDARPPRRLFGLAFESRPPPLPA